MYYLLEVDTLNERLSYRTRYETDEFKMQPSRWITGNVMGLEGKRLDVSLWVRQGDALAAVFLDSIPLFRADVVAALQECGVENLQTCPATLWYPDGKQQVAEEYLAVNILDAVRCADLERSEYDDIGGTGLMAMGFRKLIIDEAKAGGALLFRLAEAMASIIVQKKVKEHLQSKRFDSLAFRPLFE